MTLIHVLSQLDQIFDKECGNDESKLSLFVFEKFSAQQVFEIISKNIASEDETLARSSLILLQWLPYSYEGSEKFNVDFRNYIQTENRLIHLARRLLSSKKRRDISFASSIIAEQNIEELQTDLYNLFIQLVDKKEWRLVHGILTDFIHTFYQIDPEKFISLFSQNGSENILGRVIYDLLDSHHLTVEKIISQLHTAKYPNLNLILTSLQTTDKEKVSLLMSYWMKVANESVKDHGEIRNI